MSKLLNILLCFWVMWSATQVSRNKEGALTFTGGVFSGPAAETVDTTRMKIKPGDTIWHKSGAFFDSLRDCEREVEKYKGQWLICLPDGVKPK